MKGRKPKSLDDLKTTGTYRPDRHAKPVLAAQKAAYLPQFPAHLPESCRDDWQRVCGLLFDFKILTTADNDMLERYVFLLDVQRRAQAEITRDGVTTKTATKAGVSHRAHPAFRVLTDSARELRAIGERLAFDPYARQKINIEATPTGKASILDLLQGGNYKQRRYDALKARRSELTRAEVEEFSKLQKDLGIDPADFLFEN